MPRKRRYSTEQIITKLREADVLLSHGKMAEEMAPVSCYKRMGNTMYILDNILIFDTTQTPRKHPENPGRKVIDYWELHRKTRSKTAAIDGIFDQPMLLPCNTPGKKNSLALLQSPRKSIVIPPQSSAIPA